MKTREIKFRRAFWDIKTNNFVGFQYWGINYPYNGMNTFPGTLTDCYSKGDQQYTGLKDKNGKEIYEGDIIQLNPEVKYYRQVVFQLGNYWLINPDKKLNFEIQVIGTSHTEAKIIGNIYENSELLK